MIDMEITGDRYHAQYRGRATDLKGVADFLNALHDVLKNSRYCVRKPMRFSYPEEGRLQVDVYYEEKIKYAS